MPGRSSKSFMAAKAQHDYAVYLFQQGFYGDSASQLDDLLQREETAELWSDWGTAQFGLGRLDEAEKGFRRALELDPGLSEAALNFATMLFSQQRCAEAVELFQRALPKLEPKDQAIVSEFIERCRERLGTAPQPTPKQRRRKKSRRAKAKR
jgi:tetratricopeptide (TPR) repeat protein